MLTSQKQQHLQCLSVPMSQRETNNVAYVEFKGILVAFCNQTQVAIICTQNLARPPTEEFQ